MAAQDRALSALLVLLMFVGAFALWIAVPAAILWGLGKIVDNKTEHLLLALLAVPSGMALSAVVLSGLNRAYMRVNGFDLSSDGLENDRVREPQGPLDRILVVGAAIAILTFLVWLIFGSAGTVPLW